MRRIDLTRATMDGWAALRLDRLELGFGGGCKIHRSPLRSDPARLLFGDGDIDIALILRAAGEAPGEAAAAPDRKANGSPQANAPARI